MSTTAPVVAVELSSYDVAFAKTHAEAACVGGVSRLREGTTRDDKLFEDNLVGQLGQIALHRYWFGHVQGYALSRYYQNRFPTTGDGGEDVPGANLDVKTSVMRYGQDPSKYTLWVRPAEFHTDWVYVLALLPKDYLETPLVYLAGWARAEELQFDDLANRFELKASELHALPPIAYRWLPA